MAFFSGSSKNGSAINFHCIEYGFYTVDVKSN